MRVLVTGGSGRLGQFAIADLIENGHEAINASRRPGPADGPAAKYVQTDLTDVGEVASAMHGCDAVMHLGAIPAPWRHADEVVFRNNTLSTFAVLQAAHLLGIRKAVVASSVSAYGMAWTKRPFPPLFVPLDESHPFLVADPYGLSKDADERTAEMFHRRDDMQVLALRFHWVAMPEELKAIAEQGGGDPGGTSTAGMANNLWGYVDGRDAGRACRLAVEADALGFKPINIIAADTLCNEPTMDIVARYLPNTEVRESIEGFGGGFSIKRAEELIGWVPEYSWRDWLPS
jgi:nucleoside-diphosphate-sugar epimerase